MDLRNLLKKLQDTVGAGINNVRTGAQQAISNWASQPQNYQTAQRVISVPQTIRNIPNQIGPTIKTQAQGFWEGLNTPPTTPLPTRPTPVQSSSGYSIGRGIGGGALTPLMAPFKGFGQVASMAREMPVWNEIGRRNAENTETRIKTDPNLRSNPMLADLERMTSNYMVGSVMAGGIQGPKAKPNLLRGDDIKAIGQMYNRATGKWLNNGQVNLDQFQKDINLADEILSRKYGANVKDLKKINPMKKLETLFRIATEDYRQNPEIKLGAQSKPVGGNQSILEAERVKKQSITPNYTPITFKDNKVRILSPKEDLAQLMGPSVNPYESVAQTRGKYINEQVMPWEEANQSLIKAEPKVSQPIQTQQPKVNVPIDEDKFIKDLERSKQASKVKNKVNILDYIRTPQPVLEKIGLKEEGLLLKKADLQYKADLKTEIDRISSWQKQAPSQQSATNIFRALDGQQTFLNDTEAKLVKEIRSYLNGWADRLDLPKEKRISNYITHIFDRDLITKEFDPEIARIIVEKVPGSVYDPFVQKRLGQMGFKENVWQALDAYVKRGTRKVNMDPALARLSEASDVLDNESWKYVKNLGDRINMRPTEIDNLVDNLIKSSPIGYKFGQRPTTVLTQKFRQIISRGALGLNVSSALRNLTQGVNTYAELGERYTAKGYLDLARNGTKELYQNGILNDNIVQDRTVNVLKSATQKMDEGLFVLFDMAEKINRGSAYYGAKAKALARGFNEQRAIEYARNVVEKTQFKFGAVDTPLALSSDIAKTIAQFQTYTIKQAEFLGGKVASKDFAGLVRYAVGTFVLMNTVGKLFGMRITDMIPSFRFETPLTNIVGGGIKALSTDEQTRKQGVKELIKSGKLFIPAGSQLDKTYQGIKTVGQGYSTNASGNIEYPVAQNSAQLARAGLFGKYNLPEARSYYDNKRRPLSENQSQVVKQSPNRLESYFKIISDRQNEAQDKKVQEQVRQSGTGQATNDKYFYYENGQVKSIQLDRKIEEPRLTGNTELDKKRLSTYSSQMTSKINDIVKLNDLGQLSDSEAEKQIIDLLNKQKEVKTKTAKPKAITIKKAKFAKIKIVKGKSFKIKLSKFKSPKKQTQKLAKFKIIKPKLLKIAGVKV